ncbi:MAG TPA: amidase, partial [Candidatus Limnocylindrales bacterium]|nr:amidase [Candidatus Limnocylindrales bacterium]
MSGASHQTDPPTGGPPRAAGELTRLHAHEMAAGLRRGDFSARELLDAHLKRIERQDRALNAWTSLDQERARASADRVDRRLAEARREGEAALTTLPPLLGIPVALKDLVVTRGRPSTAGSRILDGFVGAYDAHIAERLDAAGAVVPGKTNMDEFAMGSSTEHSAWGPTANPWDLARVPGGSSGGTSAAVAAYHVPVGIGTD